MVGANGQELVVVNNPRQLPELKINIAKVLERAEHMKGVVTYDSIIPDTCYTVAKDEVAVFNKESYLRVSKQGLETLIYELQNIYEDMDIWLRFKD